MVNLIKKTYLILKQQGVKAFIKISLKKIYKLIWKKGLKKQSYIYSDVLFINGCGLPHPSRYRVDHQIEQLRFNGISCEQVIDQELELEMVKYSRAFIFFRCPYSDIVGEFINKAKAFNKEVFFDIDDLVIDEKYVKQIEYLQTFNEDEMALYMDGVNRMQKTLCLCDHAITTTESLANELRNYVPDVFVNRNVASEEMLLLSQKAQRNNRENPEILRIGYFSGSITHNDDLIMISTAISRIMLLYKNVVFKVVGYIDLPETLKPFEDRIEIEAFVDWRKLPELISSVDINLMPLQDTLFNWAKSENKWVEAALVKVVTIASSVGELPQIIENKKTGLLCENTENGWFTAIKSLLDDPDLRKQMGEAAYAAAVKNHISAYTGNSLARYMRSRMSKNIAFILPSTNVGGGVNVALQHGAILEKAGYDVVFLSEDRYDNNFNFKGKEYAVISLRNTTLMAEFDKAAASLWSTTKSLNSYFKFKEKFYLVQNYEINFYEPGSPSRIEAGLTYNFDKRIKYLTVSKWCQEWLKKDFDLDAAYIPNGIDTTLFFPVDRDYSGKIRILIEGPSNYPYKNVDESFKITNQLDKSRYEIWYLSCDGKGKDWYEANRFFHKIPYDEVAEIYRSCHILLKTSLMESFSYPPLEMMATGGVVVLLLNDGNQEYVQDGENCLVYEAGNYDQALEKIFEISQNEALREKLVKNGLALAESRNWENFEELILQTYGCEDLD